jgi:hypothetical protein
VNKVVNTFVKDEDKRHAELCGGAFLEKHVLCILNYLGFGWRIWGEGSVAETTEEQSARVTPSVGQATYGVYRFALALVHGFWRASFALGPPRDAPLTTPDLYVRHQELSSCLAHSRVLFAAA